MSAVLLSAAGVSAHFGGVAALSGVSFTLAPGELLGIIGPNGAGKTTLFNLISGLLQPSAGALTLNGRILAGLAPEEICRLGVGRTWQNIRLFGTMTVIENVTLALHAHPRYALAEAFIRTPRAWRMERAVEREAYALLDLFGMSGLAAERADSLSYGSQRRLELARALGTRPQLLLLDEPSAGMNASEAAELAAVIRRIHREQACAIMLIEHNLKVVRALCEEHIMVLHLGQVLVEGPAQQVLADERVVAAYLGVRAVPSAGES